jgi:GntR family transcriptional regulator of arabinose operon
VSEELKFHYQQVAEQIKQQIVSGQIRVGERLQSERQLGERFGVQRNTVRQALATLELDGHIAIQERRGAYVLPPSKRVGEGTLLINIAPGSGPNGTSLFNGVAEEAQKLGFKLEHTSTEPLPHSLMNRIPGPEDLPSDVVGVVLWPHHPTNLDRLQRLNEAVPLVLVDHRVIGTSIDCVRFDDFGGGKLVTRHLLDRGHTRIAFLSDEAMAESVHGRWQGYMAAQEEAGVSCDLRLSLLYHGLDAEVLALNMRHLMRDDRLKPTAVLCSNDLAAFSLLRFLNAEGLRVPEDVAVTGYGNSMPEYMAAISLTSVDQPFFEMGREATRLIGERTRQTTRERLRIPQDICLPVNLVARGST